MTPKQLTNELAQRHPGLGIGLGYIGSENKRWSIFTNISPPGGINISYGSWTTSELDSPLTSTDIRRVCEWFDAEVIPNKQYVWRTFSVRALNPKFSDTIRTALAGAGVSFRSKAAGRWIISAQMQKEEVERMVSQFNCEVKVQ